MQSSTIERVYYDTVIMGVRHMLNMHKTREGIDEDEIEKVIDVVTAMNKDVMDAERVAWLEKDLPFVINNHWDVLKDKKNRGRRDEIIRGVLR